MKTTLYFIIFLLYLLPGCSNSNFIGQGSQKESDSKSTDPSKDPDSEDSNPENEECDPTKGRTTVKLLTDQVKIESTNQHILFKLTLTSCEGEAIDVNGKEVLFDVDASVKNMANLAYEVYPTSKPSEKTSGQLQNVEGSDLFGNKNEGNKKYAHWRVSTLDFSFKTNEFILDLDISNRFFQNRVDPSDPMIPIFLRLGDGSPVEEKVKFVP